MTSDVIDLTPRPTAPTRRPRTWLILALIVAAVVALLAQGMLTSLNYFKTVDEVYQSKVAIGTQEIRLEGLVAKGSIARSSTGADFVVTGSHGRRVSVNAVGTPPQLFRANIPVVVVGHFRNAHSFNFYATQIMVKHTANYTAAHPDRVKAPDGTSR